MRDSLGVYINGYISYDDFRGYVKPYTKLMCKPNQVFTQYVVLTLAIL